MAKRISYIGIAVIFFGFLWYAWSRHNVDTALDSGLVTSHGTPLSESTPSGSENLDLDGQPMSGDDSGARAATGSSTANFRDGAATGPAGTAIPTAQARNAATTSASTVVTAVPGSLPATDSLPEDTANGMRFGGSGKYQWYRQGNLTWRIDTQSGSSCIAFATMEEWRKEIVYSHGCGNA